MSKQKVTVVKIGGNVIDKAQDLQLFLQSFAQLEGPKILVHGGGKLATELAERLGVPQQMIAGRRVTDEETLKIITMVYGGYINKNIVARLQALGCAALGLCGADANLLQASKRKVTTHDYGFAGDVERVNGIALEQLLQQGLSLVIAPVTHDGKGQLLNTNADTIAREIALALQKDYAVSLLYCFEKNGVLLDVSDEQSVLQDLDQALLQRLVAEGCVYEGMLPKLENAFTAASGGVDRVQIGHWSHLVAMTAGASGTAIRN
ncbi:acetylglutamate kinase [Taibaiella koreensis]|uniref:acetylglutamate kinase n=1 Tax=Taibaiella koreensis TaxID=1268548 RepID=UPI000E59B2AC|nr:acetylglutamate kinase [Taibaiella koreensis]